MSKDCCLPEYKSCCCTCRFHIADFHHCTTAWEMREQHGGCVCSVQKGWICTGPEPEGMYSGWPEHGRCEMWMEKKPKPS